MTYLKMAIAMPRCSLFQISAIAPDMILYESVLIQRAVGRSYAKGAEEKNPPNARPTKIIDVFFAVATSI